MAGRVDLVADQGATFRRRVTWRTGATPSAVDLTGYEGRMHIREQVDSEDFVAELTTDNGGVTLGGAAGTIDLFLSAADTAAIDDGNYRYDLELFIGATPEVTRLIEGKLKFKPEVTR